MARYLRTKVEPRLFRDVKKLLDLSPETWVRLIDEVEKIEIRREFSHGDQLTSAIRTILIEKNQDEKTIADINNIIHGLVFLSVSSSKSPNDFVDELIVEFKNREYELEDDHKIDLFHENLVKLLSASALFLNVKASTLAGDYERIYSESKVITDIRPIFKNSKPDSPVGHVVIHTLKITSQAKFEEQDYYFSMSELDLIDLHDQILRAQQKSKMLEKSLGNSLGTNVESQQ